MKKEIEGAIDVLHAEEVEVRTAGLKVHYVRVLDCLLQVTTTTRLYRRMTALLQCLAIGSQLERVGVVDTLSRLEVDDHEIPSLVHPHGVNEPRILVVVAEDENVGEIQFNSIRFAPEAVARQERLCPCICLDFLPVDEFAQQAVNLRTFLRSFLELYHSRESANQTLLWCGFGCSSQEVQIVHGDLTVRLAGRAINMKYLSL